MNDAIFSRTPTVYISRQKYPPRKQHFLTPENVAFSMDIYLCCALWAFYLKNRSETADSISKLSNLCDDILNLTNACNFFPTGDLPSGKIVVCSNGLRILFFWGCHFLNGHGNHCLRAMTIQPFTIGCGFN
jgi:hypothetical protein